MFADSATRRLLMATVRDDRNKGQPTALHAIRPVYKAVSLLPVDSPSIDTAAVTRQQLLQGRQHVDRVPARPRESEECRGAACERRSRHLDFSARPLLEKIASPGPLTPAAVAACVLLEAHLRDLHRAPGLAVEPVSTAADNARGRGVEVILLDDGALTDTPDEVRDRVLTTITEYLDRCATGTVTVRILPPRRALLATVVAGTRNGGFESSRDRRGRPSGGGGTAPRRPRPRVPAAEDIFQQI